MSKRKSAVAEQTSNITEVLALIETLSAEELVQVAESVKTLLKDLPMVLPGLPKELISMKDKFSIFDLGCSDESHGFDDIYPDSVHSYKLVWQNGDKMDLKIVNQRGVMYAGTTQYEIQGVQVGPLFMQSSFPKESRLPADSQDYDFEESLPEFVGICKDHGVDFQTYEQLSSFITWIMENVMEGPTSDLRYIVEHGALAKAYENYINKGEEDEVEEENAK